MFLLLRYGCAGMVSWEFRIDAVGGFSAASLALLRLNISASFTASMIILVDLVITGARDSALKGTLVGRTGAMIGWA